MRSLSAAILREQGINSVYVVTQAWHMRRALIAFAHTGITVTAAPTRFDRLPTPLAMDFVPESAAGMTATTRCMSGSAVPTTRSAEAARFVRGR